jgi:hypothetical protein
MQEDCGSARLMVVARDQPASTQMDAQQKEGARWVRCGCATSMVVAINQPASTLTDALQQARDVWVRCGCATSMAAARRFINLCPSSLPGFRSTVLHKRRTSFPLPRGPTTKYPAPAIPACSFLCPQLPLAFRKHRTFACTKKVVRAPRVVPVRLAGNFKADEMDSAMLAAHREYDKRMEVSSSLSALRPLSLPSHFVHFNSCWGSLFFFICTGDCVPGVWPAWGRRLCLQRAAGVVRKQHPPWMLQACVAWRRRLVIPAIPESVHCLCFA